VSSRFLGGCENRSPNWQLVDLVRAELISVGHVGLVSENRALVLGRRSTTPHRMMCWNNSSRASSNGVGVAIGADLTAPFLCLAMYLG
jgi:hypothetical protein